MLGLPLFLGYLPFKTPKQFLSDEPWLRVSISPTKPFYLFPTLDAYNSNNNNSLYNSINNNKRKQGFNTTFMNSCPLANNYNQTKVDLSFVGCKCFDAVKLNRSWQLDLLNSKPVCIIKTILLATTIFLKPTFMFCTCYTMKLAFKLGLKINKIKSSILKERIKTIWANKTIRSLDILFKDNPEL